VAQNKRDQSLFPGISHGHLPEGRAASAGALTPINFTNVRGCYKKTYATRMEGAVAARDGNAHPRPPFFSNRGTMPHKQVLFRSDAREKLLRGTAQLADAIRITLGPRSKSVLIE